MPHIIEFRKRAHEVSRLEAFSDVIFGFAISLLVVSLEAPKTYEEMLQTLRGFLPFTICFFIFIMIWWEHHRFFKRYALQDATTIFLNILLMFVVLFYVYPLKFMFSLATGQLHGGRGGVPSDGFRILFTVYGIGFTAVFWLLSAMYFHALRKSDKLHLNEVERIDTRETMLDTFFMGMFGVVSMALAQSPWWRLAGPVFFLIAVPKTIIPTIFGRKRRKAEERMMAGASAASPQNGVNAFS